MSDYINKYKRRLSRNGDDIGDVYANNTIAFIESTFHASPTFRVLEVKSAELTEVTEIDARVVEVERMGTLREVLFRPHQGLNIGTYVKFDNETWLVSDVWGDTSHQQKVMVQKCNRTLKWMNAIGEVLEVDCIASQSPLGSKANQGKNDIEWNKFDVRLPLGQLYVFVERSSITDTLKLNKRFIFGSNVYEVYGIDDISTVDKNGFGVIQLTIKLTTVQDKDDFVNLIAYNDYETVLVPPIEDGKGGLIW